MRKCLLAGVIVAVTSCSGGHYRKPCDGLDEESRSSQCASGEVCLWVHSGDSSGYFCVATCSQATPCPDGESCKLGGASSCATCMDLVDICE